MKLYAIKDTIIGKFMNPFLMHNDNEATRAFKIAINSNQNTSIVMNYQDMNLYKLGEYNDETGEITAEVKYITNGTSVKDTKETEEN